MTYCLGIKLNQHMILMSDSRTSAGVDNISTYSKMWRYGVPGDRQMVLCSAGNLATTQAVITAIEKDIREAAPVNMLTVKNMPDACKYIGNISVECQKLNTGGGPVFETTFILAGEIVGSPAGLYMIYSQGNFIASSSQVPFLQIGETKYGKPILDRVIQEKTPLDRAVLAALVSMDATIKSNLTVGPPIELYVLDIASLQEGRYVAFDSDDEYMQKLRKSWNILMEQAIDKLEPLHWN
ncbi:hypothetical protein TDB9533_03118 [Thalassocella blandensis]|nr:hypothetical protein TDB9533_03118 [Thalassocella blandensis]